MHAADLTFQWKTCWLLHRHTQRRACRGASTVAQAKKEYDYDLVIIGCGVGGHGAALHAVESVSSCFLPLLLSTLHAANCAML